jgi:large subunit ribosomal protein L9
MKVLLRRNVSYVGKIGEVVEVKSGYARNYLFPNALAVAPTQTNVKTVEAEKQKYLEELARQRAQLQVKADLLKDKEITISARANEEGHLYGSVGPAQIAAALGEERILVDPQQIVMEEPIRKLDRHDVLLRFGDDITATIHVWVVPIREPGAPEPSAGQPPPAEAPDKPNPPEET